MITLFGIHNCDKVKSAQKWLKEHDVKFKFHDYKKDGLTGLMLMVFINKVGHEALLNKRSTTWRNLPDNQKENLDAEKTFTLMLENVTLIKRPLLINKGNITLGFSTETYQEIFK